MFGTDDGTATLDDEQKALVLAKYEAKVEAIKALAASLEKAETTDEFTKLVVEYVADEAFESKYAAAVKSANEEAAAEAEEGDETDTDIVVPSDEDLAAIKQAFLSDIIAAVLDGKKTMDPVVELDEESESTEVTVYEKTVSVDFAKVLNGIQQGILDTVLYDYEALEQKKVAKTEGDEFFTWAFDDARKVGETKSIDQSSEDDAEDEIKNYSVTTYWLTATKRKDEDLTHDVLYMTFDDQLLAKNAIAELMENGEITREIFEEYANTNGVTLSIAESYLPGTLSGYTTLDTWLYQDGLKIGDITDVEYGPLLVNSQYLVPMYIADGEEFWYETVKRELFSEQSASLEEELKAQYTVTVKEKALNKIDA